MLQRDTLSKLLTCTAILSTSLSAHCAGLKVNIVSASALGNANAGRGAMVEDASAVYYNPAAMTEFDQKTVSGGLLFASVKGELSDIQVTDQNNQPLTVGQGYDDGGDFVPDPIVPFAFYIHPVNEKVSAGVGLFPSFGTETRYSRSAAVGEFATATKLQAIDIQPAVAYKINDKLSVGAGIDVLLLEGELSKQSQPTPSNQADSGFKARVVVKGDDRATGFNLSALWKPLETTRVGVSYHSAIDVELQGEGDFINKINGVWTLVGKEKGSVPINLPQSLDVSVDHAFNDKLSVQANALWMDWSVFNKLDVVGTSGGVISGAVDTTPGFKEENLIARVYTNWVDTITVSAGATYQVNDKLKARAGFMFDPDTSESGAPAITRVPGEDQYWLTAGASYKHSDKLSVDVAGGYILPVKAKIKDYETDADGNLYGNQAKVIADSEVNAIVVSAQMNYKF